MSRLTTPKIRPLSGKDFVYGTIAAFAIGFIAYFTLFNIGQAREMRQASPARSMTL